MEGMGNIEALSLWFAAGVAAGMALTGIFQDTYRISGAVMLLLCVPLLGRERLARSSAHAATAVLSGTFLLLGIFSALTASFPALGGHGFLEDAAGRAVEALRAEIDGIPFRSEGTAPLLKAFLSGDRSGLSRETVATFRTSGASHLLALSGLHIGIIYLIFDRPTRLLGHSPAARKVRFVLILSGAGFFTLMTGAMPSIVRAFLFIAINETLHLLGRPRKPVRVLCVALFIQLVLSPASIRDVGFQLSYLAMAGIFLVFPVLERWYPDAGRKDPVRWLWKTAALSLSCQLFTGPLAWYRFHTFPKHFLLTNLLAIPLTTGLMTVAVVTVALSAPGLCPDICIRATDTLCSLLVQVLEIISSM